MSTCTSCRGSHLIQVRGQSIATVDDGPPALERLKRFFVAHKGRVFLLGAASVLAGLAVAGLNFFSGGLTLPFTLPLSYALISFGVSAIGASCATIFSDQSGVQGNEKNASDKPPRKIKPRGQRASSAYLTRQIRPRPARPAAPPASAHTVA